MSRLGAWLCLASVLGTAACGQGGNSAAADGGTVFIAGRDLSATDLSDGRRTVVSDFSDPAQGPVVVAPGGVAVTSDGAVLVTDRDFEAHPVGALFEVDVATGHRTLVSHFGGQGSGPFGANPTDVVVLTDGRILVVDEDAGWTGSGGHNLGLVFVVDRDTGANSVLSDFGDPAQGETGRDPISLAVTPSGSILVLDWNVLFRVDATTGDRTVVSRLDDPAQGPVIFDVVSVIAIDDSTAMVADTHFGPEIDGVRGAVFTVDLASGARSLLSDFADPAEGPTAKGPCGLGIDGAGTLLATAGDFNQGGLFRVGRSDGSRELLSDNANASQGLPIGGCSVAVAPAG